MATLPSDLLKAAKAEENMYDSRCVNIWWQQTNMRAVDLMEMVGRDRYDELTKEHTNRPKPNLGAPAPTCTDLHLTNAQRQGDWTPPTMINPPLIKLIRERIHTDPLERNPDLDITGTGRYLIQVGLQPAGGLPPTDLTKAYVYSPLGKCMGHMHVHRLHMLQTEYETTKGTNPSLFTELGGTYFAADVAALLLRYRDTYQGKGTPDSETLTLSPTIMGTLHRTMQTTQERFASPLDHSPHMPSYCSQFPADQLFGATLNAYSKAWTGSSVAHPAYTEKGMHKAIRWAIASAQATNQTGEQTPTCTILALPDSKGGAYSYTGTFPTVACVSCSCR
jgi:hypothetical protein